MFLRATTSFGLHLGSSNILLTSEQSTKLTLLYANWVYVYFVITKNILGSGFQLYVIHLYKFCFFVHKGRENQKWDVSNPWTLLDAFINCNNKFCSYWFVTWLAVIFYNCKDHCSERHKSICSCEMKAWKNWSCRCSTLINNELASQQSSLHYLFSRLWVVPIFPWFLAQNSCEENQYLGFLLLAINIPCSLLMTKAITAEWEEESHRMHLIILFERLYKLHTPKSVSCERSKAWALSVVLCYLDNIIGFPDTCPLDNDLFIQLHSVEYK